MISERTAHDLLFGRSVDRIEGDSLILDDGTRLTIIPNEGCGGCPSGYYELEALNECPNMITNVKIESEYLGDEESFWDENARQRYTLFVVAEDNWHPLAVVEGTDGNGYYGTGFEIQVTR